MTLTVAVSGKQVPASALTSFSQEYLLRLPTAFLGARPNLGAAAVIDPLFLFSGSVRKHIACLVSSRKTEWVVREDS
jgi:hypothetical protein